MIDSLVLGPGAFAHYRYRYRYRSDLFATHRFRMAYNALRRTHKESHRADKAYLRVLHLAARESESGVDAALSVLLQRREAITEQAVRDLLERPVQTPALLCSGSRGGSALL